MFFNLTYYNYTHVESIRMISNIKNIIFDFDNTLHDYRYTSKIALETVFFEINKIYNIDLEELRIEYSKILNKVDEHAFLDGRTSHEYRRERFDELLSNFDRSSNDRNLEKFLVIYENELKNNLLPCTELHETLEQLKKTKRLYLASEGPQDAQIRTMEWLGINSFFDAVFTSNSTGKRKLNGELFSYILKVTNSRCEETLVVGDSYKSDIIGAKKAGLRAIFVNSSPLENQNLADVQINELKDILQNIE